MSKIEPKACPFCGGVPWMTSGFKTPGPHRWYKVECTGCGARGPESTSDDGALWLWNGRVSPGV